MIHQHLEHLKVRDYECDMQGIVNNAVYQHYLEHARHEFLLLAGIDFAEVTRAGIHLVVVRAELDYRRPLRAGEAFVVVTRLQRESKMRFAFYQDIYRKPDELLMLNAKIIGTALNEHGRPQLPAAIERLLD